MTQSTRIVGCLVLGLFVAACVGPGDIEELRQQIKKIEKNQRTILKKLDGIATGKAQPQRKPPPAPDPNAVYSFPVGDSPVKGAKDALVTIVEVSEFQ